GAGKAVPCQCLFTVCQDISDSNAHGTYSSTPHVKTYGGVVCKSPCSDPARHAAIDVQVAADCPPRSRFASSPYR
ncbi:MAG: hypothetical protein WAN99_10045, partial [Methanoculleus sp.]